jgi:iron complex outermembrane recepter protein
MKLHPTAARSAVRLLVALAVLASGTVQAQPAPRTTKSKPAAQPAPASQPAPENEPDATGTPYETVVSGRTLPRGASIEEIGVAEIERQGAISAADTLERTAAIHATTGTRGERIFALRGFDQRQVAVLLDGAPFYVTYDGQVDLNMVPALALDHITVVKGPSSVLFGPNGLGGAVNLVTRRPGSGPFLTMLFEGTPMGAIRLAGAHSASEGRWAWALYGGFDWRDHWPLPGGYEATSLQPKGDRVNSDRFMWNAGSDVSYAISAHQQVRATVLAVDGERGVSPSTVDSTPRFWRFNVWRSVAASLAHELKTTRWDVDEVAYVRRFDNLLDGYDDATYSTQDTARAMHSWYHDWVIGARARSQYRHALARHGTVYARGWLGFQEDLHEDIPGIGQEHKNYSRTLVTMAPEVEWDPTRRWRLVASGQFDADIPGKLPDQHANTRWGEGPLASVQWEPWEALVLRATTARRSRFPSLKERFSSGLGQREPNPDLRPESAWHFGLDASYRLTRKLRVDASVYDAEVTDMIQVVALGNGLDQMQNIAKARLLGAEALVWTRPVRMLQLQVGYAWLHARRTDGGPDDQIAYRPSHRAVAAVVVSPWRWLDVSADVRVVGPQDYQDPLTRVWGKLSTYAVVDARVEVRPLPWLAVWVRATNLLDSYYQSEIGYPDPGRVVWLGFKLTEDHR